MPPSRSTNAEPNAAPPADERIHPSPGSVVALFVTCLVDQVTPRTGRSALRLLEAAGYRVEFPEGQSCCGQPAYSAGEPAAAARLARETMRALSGYDAVIVPSGSCAAMLRHTFERLLGYEASDLARRTWELGEFLAPSPPEFSVTCRGKVTVHDSCHGLRELGLGTETRRLLEASGYEVVESVGADTCCGFGGVFSAMLPELSCAMADAKLTSASSSAELLVAGDIACLLHLEARRIVAGPTDLEISHYADLLAEALPCEGQ